MREKGAAFKSRDVSPAERGSGKGDRFAVNYKSRLLSEGIDFSPIKIETESYVREIRN